MQVIVIHHNLTEHYPHCGHFEHLLNSKTGEKKNVTTQESLVSHGPMNQCFVRLVSCGAQETVKWNTSCYNQQDSWRLRCSKQRLVEGAGERECLAIRPRKLRHHVNHLWEILPRRLLYPKPCNSNCFTHWEASYPENRLRFCFAYASPLFILHKAGFH